MQVSLFPTQFQSPLVVNIQSQCKKAIEYDEEKNHQEAFFLYVSCIELFGQGLSSLSSQSPLITEQESKRLFSISKQCLERSQALFNEYGSKLFESFKKTKTEEKPVDDIEQIQERLAQIQKKIKEDKEKLKIASTKKEKDELTKELNKHNALLNYYEQFIQLRVQKEEKVEKE